MHATLGRTPTYARNDFTFRIFSCIDQSNPPTQLIFITLNMVPYKKKTELAGELIRREEKYEEIGSHVRNHVYAKIKTK